MKQFICTLLDNKKIGEKECKNLQTEFPILHCIFPASALENEKAVLCKKRTICNVVDCPNPIHAKDLCRKCYDAWYYQQSKTIQRKHGVPVNFQDYPEEFERLRQMALVEVRSISNVILRIVLDHIRELINSEK